MNEYSHQKMTELVLKNSFSDRFSDEEIKEIVKGVVLPDKDENQNGYAYHFYNPVTNANYIGNELHAKAKCVYHFGEYYKTKDLTELGRAIHFLEDICTPVHTQYEDSSDSILKLKLHLDFEKELDNYIKNPDKDLSSLKFAYLVNHSYLNYSLSDFIDFGSYTALELYYVYKENNLSAKYNAIKQTFERTYNFVLNFIENYIFDNLERKAIPIKDVKNQIGVLVCTQGSTLTKYYDVATINQNYKLKLVSDCESRESIYIFKKGGALKNYVLDNKIGLECAII